MLRTESGGQFDLFVLVERVERMGEVFGHGSRMGDQGNALTLQGLAQIRLGKQAIDSEFHDGSGAGSMAAKQDGWWKSGLPSGWANAQ